MKKIIALAIFLSCFNSTVTAQVKYSYAVQFEGKKFTVDETSVVKDSNGAKLEFKVWTAMMQTGEFVIKPLSVSNGIPTEILIRTLSGEEREGIKEQMQMSQRYAAGIKEGSPLNNFTVKDIEGKSWSLEQMKGKIVVLNFWFINCMPCIQEMPHLNKLVEKYKGKDIVFLSISRTDSEKAIKKFLQKKSFKYHLISSEYGEKICTESGIIGFPTNVIIDKNGIVLKNYTGYKEDLPKRMESDIDDLLK